MEMTMAEGRPLQGEGRQDKEMRVYSLLDSLGMKYARVDHSAAETMEACREIDKILAPAVICKNLFLCNGQKTKFYLLMIRGDKKFKTREISRQINSSRLSFGPPEYMEEFLDITPGSLSVLGLMNDRENRVSLLVDEEILEGEYVGCHPCVNTSSLRLRTEDVFGPFLEAVNHSCRTVCLNGED